MFNLKEIYQTSYDMFTGKKKEPLLNEYLSYGKVGTGLFNNQPEDYKAVVEAFRTCPEAIGIVNAIITDLCSDGYEFRGKKNAVTKAKNFANKNHFKDEMRAVLLDWMTLGDGAFWVGLPTEKEYNDTRNKVIKELKLSPIQIKEFTDSDYTKSEPRSLRHLPFSTVSIHHTEDSIIEYRQHVGGKLRVWEPNHIIHGLFMKLDGKVYGYSPFRASVTVVNSLRSIKELNYDFFKNGGVPDWMFIFPMEMANNPNVTKLEQALNEKKDTKNKHGNLVITGEVKPLQLNKLDKDMEYRQMAIYLAGVLAFAFNMPITRIQALVQGGEGKSGDLADSGYWRSISSAQDYWEDLLNNELFSAYFDVEIKFNRSYKQDEIRENQVKQLQVDYLHKLIGDLKVPLKKEKFLELLQLNEDDVDEFEMKEITDKMDQSNLERKNQGKNTELMNGDGKVASDKKKRDKQNSKTETPSY